MYMRADLDELRTAYDRVFALDATHNYTPYCPIDKDCFPSEPDILMKSFISQSNTEFAQFIRALGNLDWVKEGKELYLHEDRCPFCQSKINKDELIRNITACFDEQYQEDFARLEVFNEQYSAAYSIIRNALLANINNPFPISDIQKQNYQYYAEMFIEKGRNNIIALEQKLKEPSLPLTSHEFEDLSPYLQKLSRYTNDINVSMADYLKLSGIYAQKNAVLDRIWSFMAYECRDLLEDYVDREQQLDKEEKEISYKITSLEKDEKQCKEAIEQLSAYTTNTHVVMREINKTLLAIGFRGFYLQEKIDEPYTYELVREDEKGNKEIAQDLSEGERNFIAFLYFYHTATGSQNRDGSMDDRIVIIDDPVSSMDQQTMFFVATLTRNLIDICLNNVRLKEYDQDDTTDKYIKQFFCFTHNAVFFREITYNRINDYEAVSFFEITKDKENHSHIDETYELKDEIGNERINRSPVRNYYESLWHVFRTTENIDMLMIVAHQILSHHFLQSEGYDAEDFRRILFVGENKSEFMQRNADGSVDQTYYNIAVSIINMLDVSISSYNDGMYFSSSIYTSEQIREAFRIIFETMGRISHYNMMMRKK